MGFFKKSLELARNAFAQFFPEDNSGKAVDAAVERMREEKANGNGHLQVNGHSTLQVVGFGDSADNHPVVGSPTNDHVLDASSQEIETFKDSGASFSMAQPPAPSPSIDLSAYNFPLNNKHKAQFAEVELKDKDGSITPAVRISIAADLKDKGDGKETIIKLAKELKKYGLKIEPIATKDGGKTDIGHDYAKNQDGTLYDHNNPKSRQNSLKQWTTEPYHPESYRVTVSGHPAKLEALLVELNKQSVRPFKEKIAEDRQNSTPQR